MQTGKEFKRSFLQSVIERRIHKDDIEEFSAFEPRKYRIHIPFQDTSPVGKLRELQVFKDQCLMRPVERRFKNKKVDLEESLIAQVIKKMGYKENSDFYKDIAEEKLDPNTVIDRYIELQEHKEKTGDGVPAVSAEKFEFENPNEEVLKQKEDVLTIDQDLKGIDYKLAKCCHPIYGDSIFGFVTVNGGITIHRTDCPNAPELRSRFGYRIVKAKWSGKGSSQYAISLRIVGNDDIGIVSNITNIISKEDKLTMRSIRIDSNDGLFSGNIVVQLDDTSKLNALIKKLSAIKGVKQVTRL